MSDTTDPKKTLSETLSESEQTARVLQEEAHKVASISQRARDHARITRQLLEYGSVPPDEIERLITSWRRQNDAARAWGHELKESTNLYGLGFGSTVVATSTAASAMFIANVDRPAVRDDALPTSGLANTVQQLVALIENDDILKKVRAGLSRCGLDRARGGHRGPLDLIQDSQTAIERPSHIDTSPTGVLLPLRQAIDRTITDLFDRCRGQEEASTWKDKVLSIGRRAGKNAAPPGHFDTLADVVVQKVKTLSGAKDGAMHRDQVLLAYYDGLTFINALLDGVDETKLRS